MLGLVERPGSHHGGELPRHFLRVGGMYMRELSVFVDESGVFGPYEVHSPYYIVTLLFHDQSKDISSNINHLNSRIRGFGLPDYTIHTAPLIRNEGLYKNISLLDRKRTFNALYNFVRTSDIVYHAIIVEKKQCVEDFDLVFKLTKQLSAFLNRQQSVLLEYDRIICYYDNGQRELTHILMSAFNTALTNMEFKKVSPASYKLFQAADLLCTIELLSQKAERKMLSKSEILFFGSERDFNKSYMNAIRKKRFT